MGSFTYRTATSGGLRTEREIRQLMERTSLWLAGESEDWPKELDTIIGLDLIDIDPEMDDQELFKVPEKIAVQVLRWVLREDPTEDSSTD